LKYGSRRRRGGLRFSAQRQSAAWPQRTAERDGPLNEVFKMIAVIFEIWPKPGQKQRYLDLAAELRPLLETIDGFISIERFESLYEPGKLLSLSFFRDEAAVSAWRNLEPHRRTQALGRAEIFSDYRLRIAGVIRDYGMSDRAQVPADSRSTHG
jgi:heme-degrading monooxygenase HmoA